MTSLAAPLGSGMQTVAQIESATRPQRFAIVLLGCFVALFGVTYLQRIGYVIDALTQIPICIGTTALSLALFYVSGLFQVSATRLMLFAAASAGIILSLFVALPLTFSVFSLFYLFVLYSPYVFVCQLDDEEYKAVLRLFQTMMIPLVLVTMAQFAMTMTGHGWWDFMEATLPQKMVLQGFNTHPPMSYGSPIIRPNGQFFLEPSFVSQFMGLSLLIELIYFRRWTRMGLYGVGMICSLSGTGFMMIGFYFAWMVIAQRQWTMLLVALVSVVGLIMLGEYVPVIGDLLSRATEFKAEQSSAFMRFVGPILAIGDALGDSLQLWLGGLGPGAAKQLDFGSYVMNPFVVSKLMIEEGLIGCVPFVIFATYCFFSRSFSRPLAGVLFFMYMVLSGSLQQPHTVYLFLPLSIFFIPRPEEAAEPMPAALPRSLREA